MPLLLKDDYCHTAGDPHYVGTRFLKELDRSEEHDTHLAGKFRAAGFVFLGKTNVPEMSMGVGSNVGVHGRTNNPWDVTRSLGGSSRGSCAAVAARMIRVAHANAAGCPRALAASPARQSMPQLRMARWRGSN